MSGAGDKMLNDALTEAETQLKNPSKNQVCAEHDAIRLGVYAIVLHVQDQRKNRENRNNAEKASESFLGYLNFGKLRAQGLAAVIIAIVVAIGVMYGLVEYVKAQTREAVATALVVQNSKEATR